MQDKNEVIEVLLEILGRQITYKLNFKVERMIVQNIIIFVYQFILNVKRK